MIAIIAGMKRSSITTVATIAPTEDPEGACVTSLDGFTDADTDPDTDSSPIVFDTDTVPLLIMVIPIVFTKHYILVNSNVYTY